MAKNDDFVKLAYDIADIALNCKSKEELLNSPFGNSSVSEKLIEQTGVIGEKFKSMILVELRPIMLELISTQEIRFHL